MPATILTPALYRAREVLLDVGLVREVARQLLEDDVVQREPVLERPHHLELVQQAVVGVELRVVLASEG